MYLIDSTYFERKPVKIPNINELQSDVKNEIDELIDEKVCEVLTGALGVIQFDELDSQIAFGVLDANADQKWKDLVNGVTYDGKKWNGLLYSRGGVKKSLLSDYVYYFYLNEFSPSLTGVGFARQTGKNVENVSNVPQLVKTWNRFVEQYQGNRDGGLPRVQHRYGLTYLDWLGGTRQRNDGSVTLLQYLSDHSDVYPNSTRWRYPLDNRFGL